MLIHHFYNAAFCNPYNYKIDLFFNRDNHDWNRLYWSFLLILLCYTLTHKTVIASCDYFVSYEPNEFKNEIIHFRFDACWANRVPQNVFSSIEHREYKEGSFNVDRIRKQDLIYQLNANLLNEQYFPSLLKTKKFNYSPCKMLPCS